MTKSLTRLIAALACICLTANVLLPTAVYATSSTGEDQYETYIETHDDIPSVLWQPYGNSIVFMRQGYIFKTQSDGSGLTQLTANSESGPIWSSDGTKIAFSSTRSGGDFFLMSANGGVITSLNYHQQNQHLCDWSPTSPQIAFVTQRGNSGAYIALMNTTGTEQSFLTTGFDAAWHPSGQYMIISDIGADQHIHLYEINIANHQRTQITSGSFDDNSPRYSSDGTMIVFDSPDRAIAAGSGSSICLIHRDGTGLGLVPISSPANWVNTSASFSPDGNSLVFAGGVYLPTDIYICSLNGTGLHRITNFYTTAAKSKRVTGSHAKASSKNESVLIHKPILFQP